MSIEIGLRFPAFFNAQLGKIAFKILFASAELQKNVANSHSGVTRLCLPCLKLGVPPRLTDADTRLGLGFREGREEPRRRRDGRRER